MSSAVIADESSVPLILKFLSAVLTVNSTSVELLAISNIEVPSSLIVTLAPPASNTISPAASKVISLASLVILSNAIDPIFEILASLKSNAPPTVKVPDTSTLPLISTVVAAICISVSATKSN